MRRLNMIIAVAVVLMAVAVSFSPKLKAATKSPTLSRASTAAVVQKATVKISNFQFTPKVLTITPGTTVEWVNEASRHTVEADDGSFKSDVLKQGDKFEHKFDKAGTYAYHCEFHGEKDGKDMAGKIIVRGAAKR